MDLPPCGHVAVVGPSRMCQHLLGLEGEHHVRLLTGRGLDYGLCCRRATVRRWAGARGSSPSARAHTSADQTRRSGIPHAAEPDRLIRAHHPGLPERGGMRRVRQTVQPGPLSLQPLRWHRAGLPVHPPVHHITELPAGLRELSEARSALAIFTVDSDPSLASGVIRDAGMHRHP